MRHLRRFGAAIAAATVIGVALAAIGDAGFAAAFAVAFGLVFGLSTTLAVRDTASARLLGTTGQAAGLLLALVAHQLVGFLGAAGGAGSGAGAGGVALVAAVAVVTRDPNRTPGYVQNPIHESFVRNDLIAGVFARGTAGILVGAILALNVSLHVSPVPAMLVGLSVAISVSVGFTANTWRRHVATWICTAGTIPLFPEHALQRAYQAGLLRLAGIAYEFRHLELRDCFAQLHRRTVSREGLP
jgi:hypothetical protein